MYLLESLQKVSKQSQFFRTCAFSPFCALVFGLFLLSLALISLFGDSCVYFGSFCLIFLFFGFSFVSSVISPVNSSLLQLCSLSLVLSLHLARVSLLSLQRLSIYSVSFHFHISHCWFPCHICSSLCFLYNFVSFVLPCQPLYFVKIIFVLFDLSFLCQSAFLD